MLPPTGRSWRALPTLRGQGVLREPDEKARHRRGRGKPLRGGAGLDKLKFEKRNTAWSKYAVRINGWRFNGAIEPDSITRAICTAYIKPVAECEQLVTQHNVLQGYFGANGMGVGAAVLWRSPRAG